MEHLFENPETWVLVAFVIFIALVAKKASLVITSASLVPRALGTSLRRQNVCGRKRKACSRNINDSKGE